MKKYFGILICALLLNDTCIAGQISDVRTDMLVQLQRTLSSALISSSNYSEPKEIEALQIEISRANNFESDFTTNSSTWFSTDPSDLAPIRGTTWSFTYTLISTYTDTLYFGTSVETTSDGVVGLLCYDQYQSPGAVFYMDLPQGGRGFGATTENIIIDQFYYFTVNGNSATGYYGLKDNSTGRYSSLHPMIGVKIGGGTTTSVITTTTVQPTTSTTTSILVSSSTSTISTTTSTIPNNAPIKPANPYPSVGAQNIPVNIMLSWEGGDPDPKDTVMYELFMGEEAAGSIKLIGGTQTTRYEIANLKPDTTYKWQIVATDSYGEKTQSELWNFATEKVQPSGPCPAEFLLRGEAENIELLRQFRDRVLAKSDNGRTITKLYYEKSPEMLLLLKQNPDLQIKCRRLLKAFIPSIREINCKSENSKK